MFREIPVEHVKFDDPNAPAQPNQLAYEFGELLKEVSHINPGCILEIGSHTGGTLYQWMKLAEEAVIAVDLPGVRFGGYVPEEQFALWPIWAENNHVQFNFIRADSHAQSTLDQVMQHFQPGDVDFLFIDGDHTYEGAKADFEMYGPLVRAGGIIAFHDILIQAGWEDVGVHRLWEEIQINGFKTREIYQDPKQPSFGLGLIYL